MEYPSAPRCWSRPQHGQGRNPRSLREIRVAPRSPEGPPSRHNLVGVFVCGEFCWPYSWSSPGPHRCRRQRSRILRFSTSSSGLIPPWSIRRSCTGTRLRPISIWSSQWAVRRAGRLVPILPLSGGGEKQKLGLFLQETRPDRVYSVALAPGFLDCEVRIERATSTDTVVSCTGEKAYQAANQKLNSCTTLEPRPW